MAYETYLEVIEGKGWQAFEATNGKLLADWEQRELWRPVDELTLPNIYLLLPTPAEQQTRQEAYQSATKRWPILRISDVECDVYEKMVLNTSPRVAHFTFMSFNKFRQLLLTTMPNWAPETGMDIVLLSGDSAEGTFASGFDVIDDEEFQKEVQYNDMEWGRTITKNVDK